MRIFLAFIVIWSIEAISAPCSLGDTYGLRCPELCQGEEVRLQHLDSIPISSALTNREHLLLRTVEKALIPNGIEWAAKQYLPVTFPDGIPGTFIALGTTGPTSGLLLLYKFTGETAQLIQAKHSAVAWGLSWDKHSKHECKSLLLTLRPPLAAIIIYGYNHAGTGLVTDNYFEVITISDSGFRTLFMGAEEELNLNDEGYADRHEYTFQSPSSSSPIAIAMNSHKCEVKYDLIKRDYVQIHCIANNSIYTFTGFCFALSHANKE